MGEPCPFCARVSYNPNDVQQQYCGYCHVFIEDERRRREHTAARAKVLAEAEEIERRVRLKFT
jgi:hypothetical protein